MPTLECLLVCVKSRVCHFGCKAERATTQGVDGVLAVPPPLCEPSDTRGQPQFRSALSLLVDGGSGPEF